MLNNMITWLVFDDHDKDWLKAQSERIYMNSPIPIVFSYANSFELMHNVTTQNS